MARVACIDIGTVTARLAVADVRGGRVARLAKHSEICNLGQGVDATGRLDQAAIERVLRLRAGLRGVRSRGGRRRRVLHADERRARDAENSRELGAALDSLGLDPLIIPGEVEGALTFLGVARDFPGRTVVRGRQRRRLHGARPWVALCRGRP